MRTRYRYAGEALLVLLLTLTGCREQPTILEIAQALNERQISHCLWITANVPGYGNAVLYAQTGPLECEKLWRWRHYQEVP